MAFAYHLTQSLSLPIHFSSLSLSLFFSFSFSRCCCSNVLCSRVYQHSSVCWFFFRSPFRIYESSVIIFFICSAEKIVWAQFHNIHIACTFATNTCAKLSVGGGSVLIIRFHRQFSHRTHTHTNQARTGDWNVIEKAFTFNLCLFYDHCCRLLFFLRNDQPNHTHNSKYWIFKHHKEFCCKQNNDDQLLMGYEISKNFCSNTHKRRCKKNLSRSKVITVKHVRNDNSFNQCKSW